MDTRNVRTRLGGIARRTVLGPALGALLLAATVVPSSAEPGLGDQARHESCHGCQAGAEAASHADDGHTGFADSDGDGLSDGDEVAYGTDPNLFDTDGDVVGDGAEVSMYGTNPLLNDTDDDGLMDNDEFRYGANPLVSDTDGDGLPDGDEVYRDGTLPAAFDTDGDGVGDGDEVYVFGTSPIKSDTDGDALNDGYEVGVAGTDPLFFDTDGDGMADGCDSDPLVRYEGSEPLGCISQY